MDNQNLSQITDKQIKDLINIVNPAYNNFDDFIRPLRYKSDLLKQPKKMLNIGANCSDPIFLLSYDELYQFDTRTHPRVDADLVSYLCPDIPSRPWDALQRTHSIWLRGGDCDCLGVEPCVSMSSSAYDTGIYSYANSMLVWPCIKMDTFTSQNIIEWDRDTYKQEILRILENNNYAKTFQDVGWIPLTNNVFMAMQPIAFLPYNFYNYKNSSYDESDVRQFLLHWWRTYGPSSKGEN